MTTYSTGVDFGTESGRAVPADVAHDAFGRGETNVMKTLTSLRARARSGAGVAAEA